MEQLEVTNIEKTADLGGRILISGMFLLSGIGKIGGYAGTQAYMQSQGVPGALLPLVIALEVVGAIAIIIGFRTRITAALLAGFSIVAGVLFHGGDDQMQSIMLMKNFAIAGGFLLLVARGAGAWSLDARRESLTAPGELLRPRT
jgi:putative oxidoreductase